MIKYLIKKKMQKEAEEHGKKVLIYTGAVLTGVGVYVSYKAIKNHRRKRQMDDAHYLVDSEYDMYNYDDEVEEDELQQKVDEFNSRRINCENCPDVSTEEMINYVESIKDSKDDVEINEEDYKEEEYDKYEYYEEDLEEK